MDAQYTVDNDTERQRLHALADTLREAELDLQLDNGLTVAAVLIHMAFWDDYATALLARWQESGFAHSRSDFHAVNSALGRLAQAIPARMAPDLALAAADAVDLRAGSVDADLAHAIEAGGQERILRRAAHRRQHLDQIERTLGVI